MGEDVAGRVVGAARREMVGVLRTELGELGVGVCEVVSGECHNATVERSIELTRRTNGGAQGIAGLEVPPTGAGVGGRERFKLPHYSSSTTRRRDGGSRCFICPLLHCLAVRSVYWIIH